MHLEKNAVFLYLHTVLQVFVYSHGFLSFWCCLDLAAGNAMGKEDEDATMCAKMLEMWRKAPRICRRHWFCWEGASPDRLVDDTTDVCLLKLKYSVSLLQGVGLPWSGEIWHASQEKPQLFLPAHLTSGHLPKTLVWFFFMWTPREQHVLVERVLYRMCRWNYIRHF